jgi:hypothetical protein
LNLSNIGKLYKIIFEISHKHIGLHIKASPKDKFSNTDCSCPRKLLPPKRIPLKNAKKKNMHGAMTKQKINPKK